jgi:uncharacterized protein (DUF983 family)
MFNDLRRYWQSVTEAEPATVVVCVIGLIIVATVIWLFVEAAS